MIASNTLCHSAMTQMVSSSRCCRLPNVHDLDADSQGAVLKRITILQHIRLEHIPLPEPDSDYRAAMIMRERTSLAVRKKFARKIIGRLSTMPAPCPPIY